MPHEVVRVEDVEQLGLAFSMREQPSPSSVKREIARDGAPDALRNDVSDEFANNVTFTDDADRSGEDGQETGEREPYSFTSNGKGNSLDEAMQAPTFQEFKDRAEKAFIEEKLREQNWNISRTADALDIQRSHLYTKMRKFGLVKDARIQGIPPNEIEPDVPDPDDEDIL